MSSLAVLFRISTAAGWNGVMLGCITEPPHCNPHAQPSGQLFPGDCGDMMFGSIFFCSYIFFVVCVIINMYIAVILDQFSQVSSLYCHDELITYISFEMISYRVSVVLFGYFDLANQTVV